MPIGNLNLEKTDYKSQSPIVDFSRRRALTTLCSGINPQNLLIRTGQCVVVMRVNTRPGPPITDPSDKGEIRIDLQAPKNKR